MKVVIERPRPDSSYLDVTPMFSKGEAGKDRRILKDSTIMSLEMLERAGFIWPERTKRDVEGIQFCHAKLSIESIEYLHKEGYDKDSRRVRYLKERPPGARKYSRKDIKYNR